MSTRESVLPPAKKNIGSNSGSVRVRLRPGDRRAQLLRTAGELLVSVGAEGVRVPAVAAAAGVTRPVVYRFFPNRRALLVAMLEDFGEDLERRFEEGFPLWLAEGVPALVRGFVGAACESILAKGPGAFYLMGASGAEPAIASVAAAYQDRLLEPWLHYIGEVSEESSPDLEVLGKMIVSACNAALGLWVEGSLTRAQVSRALERGILALLGEFGVFRE